MNWFCLTCPPQKEFAAERVLRQLGYEAVVPVELKYPRLSRRSRKRDKKAKPKRYPLLGARYVLSGFSGHIPMFDLWRTGLVTGVVSFQGQPVKFKPEVIKALANQNDYAMPNIAAPTHHRAFTLNQACVVSKGPFAGHTSKIVNISSDNLASLIVQFLGSPRVIEVSLDHLEPE